MDLRVARCLAGALIAGSLAAASPQLARAQSTQPYVELTWRAPADCPSRDWVLAEIARLLSGSRNQRTATAATVTVEHSEGTRWHGRLSLDAREAHSDRTLEAENCTEVASAVALVLAISVEGGVPPPPSQPATPSTPASTSTPTPTPTPAPTPAPNPHSQLSLSLAGSLLAGTMPSLAPGGEAAIGWTYSPSAFRVRALGAVSYYPTQTKFAPTTTTMGGAGTGGSERGDFWVVAGGVRGCLGRVLGAFDVGPCVGGLVGATRASGAGDGGPSVSFATQHGFAYWGAVEVGALATWNVAPAFALFARGDALVSPDPPTYVVNNPAGQATVYTVPFVAGRAVVGLEARFF